MKSPGPKILSNDFPNQDPELTLTARRAIDACYSYFLRKGVCLESTIGIGGGTAKEACLYALEFELKSPKKILSELQNVPEEYFRKHGIPPLEVVEYSNAQMQSRIKLGMQEIGLAAEKPAIEPAKQKIKAKMAKQGPRKKERVLVNFASPEMRYIRILAAQDNMRSAQRWIEGLVRAEIAKYEFD